MRGWYTVKDGHDDVKQALADFSRMTVTTTDEERTLNFELRQEGDDPLSCELRAPLVSKAPIGGATEFVNVEEWIHAWQNGIDIAYRLFLRKRQNHRPKAKPI